MSTPASPVATSPGCDIRIRPLGRLTPASLRPLRWAPCDARAEVDEHPDEAHRLDGTHPGLSAGPRAGQVTRTLRLVDDFGPVRTDLDALPDPETWAARMGPALYEVALGLRPATQVMRYLTPAVYESVVRRSGRAARRARGPRRPWRLRRVRCSVVPGDGAIVEACVVVDDRRTVGVVALRLEGFDGRWIVTACEMG